MAKKYVLFFTIKENDVKPEEIMSWNSIRGRCIFDRIKDETCPVLEELISYGKNGEFEKVYSKGKAIKAIRIDELGISAVKSYANLKGYNFCVIAQGKTPFEVLKRNIENDYNARRVCIKGDENTIQFSIENLMIIPANNAYPFYNMEDYAKQIGMEYENNW